MIFAPFGNRDNFFPTIIQSGLTIYVAAYDTNSYPYSGTTWDDLQNNFDGTLTNSPTFNSDSPRNFSFDGVNDFVTFGDSSSGSTTSDYTWGGWVYLTNTGDTGSIMGRSLDNTVGNLGWSLTSFVLSNKASAAVVSRTGAGLFSQKNVSGTTTIQANTWYYIVAVWDSGNSIKIFVNGEEEGSTTDEDTTLRNIADVGFRGWFISRGTQEVDYFTQRVSMFHLYSRALSSTEIRNNYNSTRFYFD